MDLAPLSINLLRAECEAPLPPRFCVLDLVWPLTVRAICLCQIGAPPSTNLLRAECEAPLPPDWVDFSPSGSQARVHRLTSTTMGSPIISFTTRARTKQRCGT